ncbi:MAG: hypothetical protein SOZ80_03120 [Prevotella sp.]|uniref:hypothetical protein n=1 Tax=Prevotella sp. TaxID=59823 RepID=UPI002A24F3C2|nr:hypothetical protein [Prevotella sp.]MDD7317153.1 hypothetical protein [Prevotellaceae bacterium]MDY4019757.1 hypothetical protein [Prevotella sp.]
METNILKPYLKPITTLVCLDSEFRFMEKISMGVDDDAADDGGMAKPFDGDFDCFDESEFDGE